MLFLGLVAGLALLVACANVLFRDVEHILAAALLPWFFLTPVLWRFEDLPPSVQSHQKLLDAAPLGELRHAADLRGPRPALARPARRARRT